MSKLVAFAAAAEAVTGLALMAAPSVVGQLLLGTELPAVALIIGRLAGAALFSLGLSCWPAKQATPAALCAILTYNALACLYLVYLGFRDEFKGPLLWPAASLHLLLTILLFRNWVVERRVSAESQGKARKSVNA